MSRTVWRTVSRDLCHGLRVIAMERTHSWRADQAWLPPSVRWASRGVTGLIWGGSALAIGATVAVAPAVVVMWKGLVLAGAGAAVAGRQAGRAAFQRQLRKLARGDLALAQLDEVVEGELVVVRGRIECERPLTGVLVDTPCVYRRMVWEPNGRWVSEAAVDFALVDERGGRVLVQGGGARWMVGLREPWAYPLERFQREGAPAGVRELARHSGAPTLLAHERVLEVGAEVQVVGYKTASADVSGSVIDYRLPPQRATLRSGPRLPVVITRLADLDGHDDDDA